MSKLLSFVKTLPFWFLFIWTLALALLTSGTALVFSSVQWLQTAALIIWVAFFFLPVLPLIDFFEEVGIPGVLTLKTRQKVAAIQQTLVQNRVVRVVDVDKTHVFWVDDSKTPHRIQDKDDETATFLAGRDGILEIDMDQLKQLKPIAKDTLPEVVSTAIPKRHGGTVFILYNHVLYYQSSLGFLYRLAALIGYAFTAKDKSIAEGGWDDWIEQLSPKDLTENSVK